MDFSKLSQNQQIALGGGAVAVLSLFLPWYGIAGFSSSGFDSGFLAWGGLLLAIAGAAILIMKAMEVTDVKVGNLAAVRDFSDVRDTARYLRVIADKGETGGIYNLCSGKTYSIKNILDTGH